MASSAASDVYMRQGYKRFQQEVVTKYKLKHNPESVEIPELASEINQWLTVEKDISSLRQLNTWERNFCESVRLRVIMGQELTPKQVAIIEKIRKNFA